MGYRRVGLFITLVLILLLLPAPSALSSETNENEELYAFLSSESPAYTQLFDFLSDVVQFDLTKYGVVPPESVPPGFEGLSPLEFYKQIYEYARAHGTVSPPNNTFLVDRYGGLAKEENLSPDFGHDGTRFGTQGMFVNGYMYSLSLTYYGEEDYVYSEPQPADIVGRAKGILQRYQAYFKENYGYDALYLVPILDKLTSNNRFPPADYTEGNLTFHFSQKDSNRSLLEWIYTEETVEIDQKRVSIEFRNNAFDGFHDSWGLYNVSGLNTISLEKAVRLVLAAAQNGELRRTLAAPGTGYVNISELVDTRYSVSLMMAPFKFDSYSVPSKISRDPLTIYPLLHIYFYFNSRSGGSQGLELLVWGDTGEIRYCTAVGKGFYENGPMYYTNDLLQNPQPTEEQEQFPSDEPEETQPTDLNPLTLLAVGCLVAVPTISISVLALKRKTGTLTQAN